MASVSGSRSSRISMRRALFMLVRLHWGDASRQELIHFVERETGDPAIYGSRTD